MKPYSEYYSVDFDYTKVLPKGWKLLPNIALFENRIEKGHIGEELLSVTIGRGVVKQSEIDKKDSSNPDKSGYKLVYPGDLVYSMRFRQGASGFSLHKGLVSSACTVLKPKMKINPKFFHYQFRLPFYQDYAKRYSFGIADGQLPLRYNDFKRMYSVLPPLEIQNWIVKHLDQKEKMIEKYLKNKEQIIELSLQQIFSLIFEKKTISSRLGWRALFCANWKIEKAKWIFSERNIRKKIDERLIAVTQHKGAVYKDEIEENYVSPTDYTNLKLVCKNDFIISLRSFEGGIEYSKIQGIVSPAYTVFYTKDYYDNEEFRIFYSYLFKSKQFIGLLNTIISGIRDGKNVNYKDFRNLSLPIPDMDTMRKIYRLHENLSCAKSLINKEIVQISNYIDSLVFNSVLGKIDSESTMDLSLAAESLKNI